MIMSAGHRVLYVAYLYPPVGGAGVQRSAKFVKYLPHFAWHPSVLTVANPSVPLFDQSLTADVPAQTIVRRARTWEPGYALKAVVSSAGGVPAKGPGLAARLMKGLVRRVSNLLLQPDPQILWAPHAIREGRRLLREVPHHAIVASGPPFSSFLVGAALARWSGLPLVLDYRDEWDISHAYMENKQVDPLSRFIQRRMQASVVRSAQILVATTPASARALDRVRAAAGSGAQVEWIYNGYDPEDFAPTVPARGGQGPYRLAYVGTLWNLTSVAPLVEAVRRLAQTEPVLAADLELVFVGRRTNSQDQILARLEGLPCRVVRQAYMDHRGAVDLIRSASGLSLLLSDTREAERVVPAKIFEYMAARQPIVAITPRGEVWDLLRDYPAGHLLAPRDVEGIAACLAREIRRHRAGQSTANWAGWDADRYDRRSQAGQLATILSSLQDGGRPARRPAFAFRATNRDRATAR
jgi:glycosyltransferase involved in cell wall biosynthesis